MNELVTITLPTWLVWAMLILGGLSVWLSILIAYYKRKLVKLQIEVNDTLEDVIEELKKNPPKKTRKAKSV